MLPSPVSGLLGIGSTQCWQLRGTGGTIASKT